MTTYELRIVDSKNGSAKVKTIPYEDRRDAVEDAILTFRPADAAGARRVTLTDSDGNVLVQKELNPGCYFRLSYGIAATGEMIEETFADIEQAMARREQVFAANIAEVGVAIVKDPAPRARKARGKGAQ